MKYELQPLPAQPHYYYYCRFKYDVHEIALHTTIMNSTRVHLIPYSDPNIIKTDWCCGRDALLVIKAVVCIIYCIDTDKWIGLPPYSNIKPYDLDTDFDFVSEMAGKMPANDWYCTPILFPFPEFMLLHYKNIDAALEYIDCDMPSLMIKLKERYNI